jgi:putative exosortase-associated protein (TIGR04073 family)
MRKMIFPLIAVCAALVFTGCAGPEHKLGRGLSNSYEVIRWGDMRRSIEQSAILDSPDTGYTYGAYSGFHKSAVRFGLGLYEVVTFPLPPYRPLLTDYIPAHPQSPESYKPGLISDPLFDTDTFTGFSGGDIAPFIPGSRFKVFDN